MPGGNTARQPQKPTAQGAQPAQAAERRNNVINRKPHDTTVIRKPHDTTVIQKEMPMKHTDNRLYGITHNFATENYRRKSD